jgi:DNA-binding transcriptional LysR family regulator
MDRLECDRMYVAVMETGSFAKAAQRLNTSSGQASKLVSRLEEELGARLLNRTTRALAPTEVGQAYFERIRHLLDELDALDESVKSHSGAASGRLRLTAPMSFGTVQLAPALIDFARSYPAIELDVSFSDRVVNLVDEGFDAGVRIGNPADSTLIVRKLCDARVVVAASPQYLAAHGEIIHPEDLSARDCILDTNFRDPFTWRFRDPAGGAALAVPVKGRLLFSSADACLAAAEDGLGIARAPSFMAGPRFRDGRLVSLLRDYEDHPLGIHVIYPPGRHLAIKVRVLVDFLVQRFQGEPSWDIGWQFLPFRK